MSTTSYREMIPFNLNEFDPAYEYFALEKDDSKACSYRLYAIGASKEVSVYRDGFLSPALVKDFLCALTERLYYFKEHPPVLVTKEDLYKIAELKRLKEPLDLSGQLLDAKKESCWRKRNTSVQEHKSHDVDRVL